MPPSLPLLCVRFDSSRGSRLRRGRQRPETAAARRRTCCSHRRRRRRGRCSDGHQRCHEPAFPINVGSVCPNAMRGSRRPDPRCSGQIHAPGSPGIRWGLTWATLRREGQSDGCRPPTGGGLLLLRPRGGFVGPADSSLPLICSSSVVQVRTAWAMGLIIGPALGGYLAQPTEKYPKLFPTKTIFERFPYFLSSLCISVFYFIILLSCMWLPETLHSHKYKSTEDQSNESLIQQLADLEDFDEQKNSSSTNKSILKNWPLMSSIILFCIVSFDDMAYTEIFPLWVESERRLGGLSLSSDNVSQVLAITGATILLYQTFVYPHMVKLLGPIITSRIMTIFSMALLITYPFIAHLHDPWLSIVLNIASMLKANCE